MIFNEFIFVFLFLPLVLVLFYLPGLNQVRPYVLLIASFVFYAYAGIEHAMILFFDIVWVYLLTSLPGYRGNRPLVYAASIPPVLALLYYKYTFFIIGSISGLSDGIADDSRFDFLRDIALPAGISFFTFQVVAYAIDRYRGTLEEGVTLPRLALFVSFFPQLVAGPIVRYQQIETDLDQLRRFRPSLPNLREALVYIISGLAMKVLIADTISRALQPIIDDPTALSRLDTSYLILGYSFQIYFDFYGYSLAAIGLALLFGVRLPVNFKRPYSSLNPRDFWRRWHVTLSFWIRDYLYKPLGGNRSYIRNIAITFAICGLWHGAAWSFVIWGLYHGLLVAMYKVSAPAWDRMPNLLQKLATFTLVSAGWTLFVFDASTVMDLFTGLALGNTGSATTLLSTPTHAWLMILVAALVCFSIRVEKIAERPISSGVKAVGSGVGLAALTIAVLLFLDLSDSFIYFRF